ncbi:hypothetical protein BO99DRAFT_240943 [Aspergillus violaceofuscus CBS 115571]|uniref:Uncharacterized protein n=1 Tax=Aspergillus violaceofuscus (strain CBS 115571) TaxID=1450538 RepID=A0A2V5ISK6_ASPV1|nr:hypothetical protein BO99DRAFT_240943 [Aspergillus violaceofuscus CBS 115571]
MPAVVTMSTADTVTVHVSDRISNRRSPLHKTRTPEPLACSRTAQRSRAACHCPCPCHCPMKSAESAASERSLPYQPPLAGTQTQQYCKRSKSNNHSN